MSMRKVQEVEVESTDSDIIPDHMIEPKIEEAKKMLQNMVASYAERASQLKTLYARLESEYGIKMDAISYDEKSGKITEL